MRVDEFLKSTGSEFHIFGAETEKELSNIGVCDLGTARVPLDDDLRCQSRVSATGFSKFVIYSGVWPLRALYVNMALLNANHWYTGCQPNSANISKDGVR